MVLLGGALKRKESLSARLGDALSQLYMLSAALKRFEDEGQQEADLPLLFQIYASTRETELAMVPWTDEQKHQFLVMQFHCQHTDYHQNYPDCAFDIVELDGQPVGRLYLDRRADEFRIVDIAILPPFRCRCCRCY